jgi:GNAT superfamily N-acetyltransferase
MSIRNATLDDHAAINDLLNQLGYPGSDPFLLQKMIRIANDPAAALLVYESEDRILAFMAINFITQLALEGDFARISYLAVDQTARNTGIGKEMIAYGEQLARNRKCDRIEVHCHQRRTDAIRFYDRQGYTDSPKYMVKSLS